MAQLCKKFWVNLTYLIIFNWVSIMSGKKGVKFFA